jgi:type IV pilus assembly protein PilA
MNPHNVLTGNANGQRPQDEGFTLIELLIVMSIMLVLMAIAIPNALKLYKQANETSAQQSMQYSSAYPQNGFACGLSALGGAPGTAPTEQAAQILDAGLASGSKSGYLFTINNCTKVTVNNHDMYTGYNVTAVPASVGKTGDRGYCMDENNIIKYDPAGGTNCTQAVGQ